MKELRRKYLHDSTLSSGLSRRLWSFSAMIGIKRLS